MVVGNHAAMQLIKARAVHAVHAVYFAITLLSSENSYAPVSMDNTHSRILASDY